MTGFTAPNYFAKSFKAKFNMLPTEYKQKKRRQYSKAQNQLE
jgi:AraC-like DNA-binding protein